MTATGAVEPESTGSTLSEGPASEISEASKVAVSEVAVSEVAVSEVAPSEVSASGVSMSGVAAAEAELATVADTDIEQQPERYRTVHSHLLAALADTDIHASRPSS